MKTQRSSPNLSGKGQLHFAIWMALPGVPFCEWFCFEVASENYQYYTLSFILGTQINKNFFLENAYKGGRIILLNTRQKINMIKVHNNGSKVLFSP